MWITQGVGQSPEDDPEDEAAVVVELVPESVDVLVSVDAPESF